jgi:hypothetical protein
MCPVYFVTIVSELYPNLPLSQRERGELRNYTLFPFSLWEKGAWASTLAGMRAFTILFG